MKIWVTYNSAFSLQCGGLERVWVWFRQPEWVDRWRDSDELPFASDNADLTGRRELGWTLTGASYGLRPVSFGKIFGYGDEKKEDQNAITRFVWTKLEEHFSCDFMQWDKAVKSPKDFLLELDLSFYINNTE